MLSETGQRTSCNDACRAHAPPNSRADGRFRAVQGSTDQEDVGGPREGGSRKTLDATDVRVAIRSDSVTTATRAGSDNVLGKMAADADPEQKAQCDEACFGA
jgi:hypothetical protein